MPLMSIVYAALVGLGIVLMSEAPKSAPGNWTVEMREYQCRAARLAPHIGANDPCKNPVGSVAR